MINQEILERAMKKAVEVELLSNYANLEEYIKYWDGMKTVLETALDSIYEINEDLLKVCEVVSAGNPYQPLGEDMRKMAENAAKKAKS